MPHRTFRDEQGREWEAWEVVPTALERRLARDGSRRTVTGQERRRAQEARVLVPEKLQYGWLAFQSGADRRRLAPIPDDWLEMTADELATLLDRADRRTRGRKPADS
jgi:hypothetical protein